ncbi:MAG: hypothetical protein DRZ79_02050 [Candidatus Cloacimonadota bacterium]|nr:MAG: hypothetical protein DRZ79_02050 [Candidatus Cloacimonadota bacterium]
MEYQEDSAVVTECGKDFVKLEIIKSGACKSCSLSNLCAANQNKVTVRVKTDLDLKTGDIVKIYISPGTKLFSSFLIFIFPIISMIIFYFLGKYLFAVQENVSILLSFLGLLFSGIVIYYLDKVYQKKINYKIIAKIE